MKQKLLAIVMVCLTYPALSQTIVSTVPAGRNAVLEELTGVTCPNCPDGHVRADALYNAYPGRVVIMNLHGTAYSGTPNLKSSWVDPIDNFINPTGYPSGSMNRKVWPGAYNEAPYFPQNPPGNLAIRRPGWWDTGYPGQTTGEWIILNGGNSFVNIGATSSYNSGTGVITINVELYYTSNSPDATNKINVAILQNGVIGYQSGGSSNYNHKNILRDLVTGQWGESITTTSAGTLVSKTYNYTLPANYNGIASDINNMDVVVFVTQSDNKNIETGIKIKALNGSTLDVQETKAASGMSVYPNPVTEQSIIAFSLSEAGNTRVQLTDLGGRTIWEKELGMLQAGPQQLMISRSDMAASAGMYLVSILSGNSKITRKLFLE